MDWESYRTDLEEVFLVSIGHNLYKYYNKQKKTETAA